MSEPILLTRSEVAALLGCKDPHATDDLVAAGKLPAPIYIFSRSPRWRRSDVVKAVAKLAKSAQSRPVQMERSA